jgi:hypothetical protein
LFRQILRGNYCIVGVHGTSSITNPVSLLLIAEALAAWDGGGVLLVSTRDDAALLEVNASELVVCLHTSFAVLPAFPEASPPTMLEIDSLTTATYVRLNSLLTNVHPPAAVMAKACWYAFLYRHGHAWRAAVMNNLGLYRRQLWGEFRQFYPFCLLKSAVCS